MRLEVDNNLTKAINTNDKDKWRLYKNSLNNLTKYIKTLYNDYIKIRFTNYKDKWKCLKETNSNKRLGPPSTLINKGQTITSPRKNGSNSK